MRTVVATVAGIELELAAIEDRLATVRRGPLGARLPAEHTAEGRTLRRWAVQLCAAELLVEQECRRRGLVADDALPSARRPDLQSALGLGGVAAATLVRARGARALAAALSADVTVSDEEVRGYYERNLDLYADGDRPLGAVAAGIRAELAGHEQDRRFADWLERAFHRDVRLSPGFEHPGEPGHPDSTHRH